MEPAPMPAPAELLSSAGLDRLKTCSLLSFVILFALYIQEVAIDNYQFDYRTINQLWFIK